MSIVAVANQTDGVDSTSTTLGLAAALQAVGRTVLLLDLDPRARLTAAAGGRDGAISITDLLAHAARARGATSIGMDEAIVQTASGYDLVPATAALAATELALASVLNRESVLHGLLLRLEARYDLILIDCPESAGLLMINALRAANAVVLFPDTQASLAPVLETIERVHAQLNPELALLGAAVRQPIGLDARVPVFNAAPDSFRALACELLGRLGEDVPAPVDQRVRLRDSAPRFPEFLAERRAWIRNSEAAEALLGGRFDVAAATARRELATTSGCLTALRVLAWAQLELGEDRALETFQRCAELDPEDALACIGQAIWYQQRLDNTNAIACWVRAWELEPEDQPIRRALVKLTGELPESPLAEAIGLLRNGSVQDCVEQLRALRRERADAAIDLALLSALTRADQESEALRLASGVHAAYPRSVKATLYVAAIEERAGRTLRSRELLARAEHADPGLILFADVARAVGLQPARQD